MVTSSSNEPIISAHSANGVVGNGRRTIVWLIGAAVVLIITVGAALVRDDGSDDNINTSAAETGSAQAGIHTTTTSTATLSGGFGLESTDGYSYDVETIEAPVVSASLVDAAPGDVDVVITGGSTEVTNTTPGRNAQEGPIPIFWIAIPLRTPTCEEDSVYGPFCTDDGMWQILSYGGRPEDGPYYDRTSGFASAVNSSAEPIPEGASYQVVQDLGSEVVTFDELSLGDQDFFWSAGIAIGDLQLYLEAPELSWFAVDGDAQAPQEVEDWEAVCSAAWCEASEDG